MKLTSSCLIVLAVGVRSLSFSNFSIFSSSHLRTLFHITPVAATMSAPRVGRAALKKAKLPASASASKPAPRFPVADGTGPKTLPKRANQHLKDLPSTPPPAP
ncbi:hypothetical protein ASPTUDRAFT_146872, partial [Aspergillus tubingensis CBS 134.48]